MESILFLSAAVITGEEDAKPFVADVLVQDGLIAQIGEPGTVEGAAAAATRRIDARGQFLSPGFIDMHAHSDLYLITNPVHEAKISQGCTVRGMRIRPANRPLELGREPQY
jgi:N-acyl-D-amino-acid deacylase